MRTHGCRYSSWVQAILLGASMLPCRLAAGGEDHPQSIAELNQRAIELNRSGDWKQAAEMAEATAEIAHGSDIEKAEAWWIAAYARNRLGERDRAQKHIGHLTVALQQVPEGHWLHAQADALQRELAEPVKARAEQQRANAPDIGATLFEMKRANASRDWGKAIEHAGTALAHPVGDMPAVKGEALMHLYFAQRKLNQHDQAGQALERFIETAKSMSADSKLPLEMMLVRRMFGDSVAEIDLQRFQPGPDDFWVRADPVEVDMDANVLAEHEQMCRDSGADAVLVARRGKIVSEWYSPLYREPVLTMSSVKSITALLAGLLIADGKIQVDDPVGTYVPEWNDGARSAVTVEHLLTMTSGLLKARSGGVGFGGSQSLNALAISMSPSARPGAEWSYSNEGVQLLSPVLERAAGTELWKYANQRLFAPMGLKSTEMRRDEAGCTNTFADAKTTLREFAKFGILMLQGGRWADRQVVPEPWLQRMLAPCALNPEYGYLCWLSSDPKVWAMKGYLDTCTWVFPDLDLVVTRVQSSPYLHTVAKYDERHMYELMQRACSRRRR